MIATTNALDKEKYLALFTDDAVLDDPSVGRAFNGKRASRTTLTSTSLATTLV